MLNLQNYSGKGKAVVALVLIVVMVVGIFAGLPYVFAQSGYPALLVTSENIVLKSDLDALTRAAGSYDFMISESSGTYTCIYSNGTVFGSGTDSTALTNSSLTALSNRTLFLKGVAFDLALMNSIPNNVAVIESVNGLSKTYINPLDAQGDTRIISVEGVNYLVQDKNNHYFYTLTNSSALEVYAMQSLQPDGGKVIVEPGLYVQTAPWLIFNNSWLQGVNRDTVILQMTVGYNWTNIIAGNNDQTQWYGTPMEAMSNCSVSDLTVDGQYPTNAKYGVYVYNENNQTGISFRNVFGSGLIQNCKVINQPWNGIQPYGECQNLKVIDNTVSNIGFLGIEAWADTRGIGMNGLVISGNTVTNIASAGGGIKIEYGVFGASITNNHASTFSMGPNCTDCTITGNTFRADNTYQTTGNFYRMNDCNNNTINGNTFIGCPQSNSNPTNAAVMFSDSTSASGTGTLNFIGNNVKAYGTASYNNVSIYFNNLGNKINLRGNVVSGPVVIANNASSALTFTDQNFSIAVPYNGKIVSNTTTGDTNKHTLDLATLLSETRSIVIADISAIRQVGTGAFYCYPNEGTNGMNMGTTVGAEADVMLAVGTNRLQYSQAEGTSYWDVYCFGYWVSLPVTTPPSNWTCYYV